eukprot:NODE_62_length_4088_cov_30.570240_g49_i1.p1 GENE.NODE_62_length_4088_cov_30.570240_g49_i1~~NODE_62_length_4088_cov_30.570240_g49_i1.p1  ORF type:complete len:753 (-),score=152.66 NODE_62_length_4088_cov_30.570240_g49_i1:112-2370(-)
MLLLLSSQEIAEFVTKLLVEVEEKDYRALAKLFFCHHNINNSRFLSDDELDQIAYCQEDSMYNETMMNMVEEKQKEHVFQMYCKLLEEFNITDPKGQQQLLFKSLEEKWARFYRLYSKDSDELDRRFELDFAGPCRQEFASDPNRMITNPGLLVRKSIRDGGANAVRLCNNALNEDPRHWEAATLIPCHMLNANTYSDEVYSKEEVIPAIKSAAEVTQAALLRRTCILNAQNSMAIDSEMKEQGIRMPEFEIIQRQLRSPASQQTTTDITSQPTMTTHTNNRPNTHTRQSNLQNTQQTPSRDISASQPTTNTMTTPTQTNTFRPNTHTRRSVPSLSNLRNTQETPSKDISADPEIKILSKNLEALSKLAEKVNKTSNIAEIMVDYDPIGSNSDPKLKDAENAAQQEGYPGVPKPTKRPKRGSWWPIIVGAICCAVGAYFVAAYAATTTAFKAGCALIGSGLSDIATGIQSLITGNPVSVGQWFAGKVSYMTACLSSFFALKTTMTKASEATFRVAHGFLLNSPNLLQESEKERYDEAIRSLENKVHQTERRHLNKEQWLNTLAPVERDARHLVNQVNPLIIRKLAIATFALDFERLRNKISDAYITKLRRSAKWNGPQNSFSPGDLLSKSNIANCFNTTIQDTTFLGLDDDNKKLVGAWNLLCEEVNSGDCDYPRFQQTMRSLSHMISDDMITIKPGCNIRNVPGINATVVNFLLSPHPQLESRVSIIKNILVEAIMDSAAESIMDVSETTS